MGDSAHIRHFLYNCVVRLGLRPVRDTLTVATFPVPGHTDQFGVSGTIILTESHLAIHTWPEEGYARIELSSCAPVNKGVFEQILHSFFLPDRCQVTEQGWTGGSPPSR